MKKMYSPPYWILCIALSSRRSRSLNIISAIKFENFTKNDREF